MSERLLQFEIREALGLLEGCAFFRINSGVANIDGRMVRFAPKGISDLIGIVDGRFCALEIKQPGERPNEEQRKWMNVVRIQGGFAAVVTSVTDALEAVARCRAGEVS